MVQGQRHRGCRGVAVLIHRDNQAARVQLELAGRALHDADVGLVGDQPVHVSLCTAGLGQHRTGHAFQHTHGQPEHGLAVHLEQRVAEHLPARHSARHAQNAHMRAIGVKLGGQDARCVAGFEHHGPGSIAKQHAGGAVLEVQDAGEHLGAHHQGLPRRARPNHGVSHGQPVHKARTDRLQVKRWTAGHPKLVLQDGGRRGEDHVGRGRGHDDQVDLRGLAPRGLQGVACSVKGEIAGVHPIVDKVPGADARALHDPVVAGLQAALSQQTHHVGIGQPAGRQKAAGASDSGVSGYCVHAAAGRPCCAASPSGLTGSWCEELPTLLAMRCSTRSSRRLRAAS